MELIKQLLHAFLALWLLKLTDAQTVTVTIGEFAAGVFIEWVGYFSDFPTGSAPLETSPGQAFYSTPTATGVFTGPDFICK